MVAQKKKQEHMSNADWAAELTWRAVITADLQRHCKILLETAVEEAKAASFAGFATNQGDSGGEGFFDKSTPAARSGTNNDKSDAPRLPPSRMSPKICESGSYPRTFNGGIFSPVTVATRPQPVLCRVAGQCAGSQTCSPAPPLMLLQLVRRHHDRHPRRTTGVRRNAWQHQVFGGMSSA
jgi:hypothetical protein